MQIQKSPTWRSKISGRIMTLSDVYATKAEGLSDYLKERHWLPDAFKAIYWWHATNRN